MNSTLIHVTQALGGVETYLELFLSGGAFDGFQQRVLVVPERTALADAWERRGGSVEVLPMRRAMNPFSDLRTVIQLRGVFNKYPGAVIHLHSSKAGALGRIASLLAWGKSKPTAVIYTPHAFYFLALSGVRRRIFLAIERMLAPLTGCVLATSSCEARRARDEVGFAHKRVECVPNAVKVAEPKLGPRRAGPFEVIFVGRICYQKNVEVFLDVVRRFRGDKNIHFTLVGAGHYAGDKEYLERSLGAGELDEGLLSLIDWMPRDQLLDLYAQADVCILTSRYESFGYVVAEANAVGTPAVVSGVDGVRDIVLDGVSGYINPDSSAESFYDALAKLRDNPELLAEMGRHAHARVLERFNIEKNARMLAEFYDKQLLLAR